MWRLVVLVVAVLLAGCSGLLASDGATSQTVTPAPVPESGADESVSVPETNGSVDFERLLARHDAALETRSFHRRLIREGPHNTRDVWVDRQGGVVRVRQTFGPLTNDAVVTDGTIYHNVRDDPDTDFERTPRNGTIPYVSTLSGRAILSQLATMGTYRHRGTVERDGRPVAVLEATNTTDLTSPGLPERTVTIQSRLYVDRRGIVRHVDHRGRRIDGSLFSVEMRITTGLDRVPIPWWLEAGDPYTSGSM